MTIYVSTPPGNIARMRPLLRLLFDQAVNLNTDTTPEQDPSLKVPVLLVLDEFARLGKVETIAESLQFVRGFGIRVVMVVQNKAQIKALYGNATAADIFDNLGVELVFGINDLELAEEIEKRAGDKTVLFDTVNAPRFMRKWKWTRQTTVASPHRRPVILDQEVLQMPPTKQIIMRPGMKPAWTERIRWYEDENFTRLEAQPPEVPGLQVQILADDGTISIPTRRRAVTA
jgi:type IV secretion system protein VirD4